MTIGGSKGGTVASGGQVPATPGAIGVDSNAFKALFNVPGSGSSPQTSTPSLVGGIDPNEIMKEMFKPIDPAIIERAITPVPSGHSMGLPPSMTTPVEGFNPYPMDQREVVGAGNAKARGIGNAITGVANAIGQFTVAKQQKDQRTLAGSTTRLIQAQHSIDQAKQALTDPGIANNPEAKKNLEGTIEKNTNIMNDILADDKTRKGIEKGYNISFTDPQKNKTPEHDAVRQGQQEAKQSLAEQFASKMPTEVGPAEMAQQRMQVAQMQQAAQAASAKSTLSYVGLMQRLGVAVDIAKMKEVGENARKGAELTMQWDKQSRAIKAAGDLMDFRFKKEFEAIDRRADAMVAASQDIYDYKNNDPATVRAKWGAYDLKAGEAISAAANAVNNIMNNMAANQGAFKSDPVLKKHYDDDLKIAEESLSILTKQRQATRDNMTSMFGPKFVANVDPNSVPGAQADGPDPLTDIDAWTKRADDVVNDIEMQGAINMFGGVE